MRVGIAFGCYCPLHQGHLDVTSVVMFIILGNWVMVAQYIFWTINCIYGWVKWSKSSKAIEV